MKLYIWGTGCGAGDLADHGLDMSQVCAFLDSAPVSGSFLGRPVLRPEEVKNGDIDLILVTRRHVDDIAHKAAELGIGAEKLVFLKSNWQLCDRNRDYTAAEALLDPAYLDSVKAPQHTVRDPLWVFDSPLAPRDLENDYVRMRTLEALCRELDNVPGAAAELGVYRGGSARCINALLPDRTLYLFDTFEGFDPAEARGEAVGFVEAHRNTGADLVLRLMPHPEKVTIRQGLFPASLGGLEDRFALVSLDVDLEESSLAGLRWFYPRLAPGGFLLLHDYNSPRLPGVKLALRRYESELGQRLPAVPLCDVNGTMVLCKYHEMA